MTTAPRGPLVHASPTRGPQCGATIASHIDGSRRRGSAVSPYRGNGALPALSSVPALALVPRAVPALPESRQACPGVRLKRLMALLTNVRFRFAFANSWQATAVRPWHPKSGNGPASRALMGCLNRTRSARREAARMLARRGVAASQPCEVAAALSEGQHGIAIRARPRPARVAPGQHTGRHRAAVDAHEACYAQGPQASRRIASQR